MDIKQNIVGEVTEEVLAILKRVHSFMDEEDFEAALFELNKVKSLEKNAYTLYVRGVIKYSLKRYLSAVEDLNTAEKLNPHNDIFIQIILFRVTAYLDSNMIREAYADINLWNENMLGYLKWKEEKNRVEKELLKGHPMKEFDVIKLLDEGAFGKVHLATWNGKHVALKTPLKVSRDAKIKEALTSMKFRHENIVSALGLCNGEGDEVSFVMEYAEDGSLHHLLYKQEVKLTREQILFLACDIASGLAYLHKRSIIHRDLKSANILLFEQKTRAKIADFGQSRFLREKSVAKTVTGTFGYIAPEVLAEQDYDEKADVYSFGVVLYEMCTNNTMPILGIEEDRMQKIRGNIKDEEFRKIIMHCCKTDPQQRPTSQKCLKTITKLLEVVQKQQRLDAAREQCRTKFKEFLPLWQDLDTSVKRSIVTMFLSLKYETGNTKPANSSGVKHTPPTPRTINTDELIPADFAFKKEFIDMAKDVVANYPTDQEKELHLEFAPQHIYDDLTPAQIVVNNNLSSLAPINVLLIGDDDEIKRSFAERFCPSHFVNKRLSLSDSQSKVSADLFGNSRTLQLIDMKLNVVKNDPSLFSLAVDFITHSLTPKVGGPIHIMLVCIHKSGVEPWMRSISDLVSKFAQVIGLQIIVEDNKIIEYPLQTGIYSRFHTAEECTINGIITYALDLNVVARSLAEEASNWIQKYGHLLKLFEENPTEYYNRLISAPEKKEDLEQKRCTVS